ncbi:ribonuclease P protein subunit p25-like protein isoform X2 [Trematomus bernacchii]|uniref:ribonuclease P protein subunit p25-like protein isoform X2 n=1 Tax=Trematomus bernacchii TaxID=40690 RepID=UPI00146F4E69|nr:ribonuclease P protein subunit p25-like protein isoform X2 [Trematomus bernacchii]
MENYAKARTLEHPSVCPFLDLPPDTPEVRVKDGSKIRNLLRFCQSRMEARPRAAEKEKRPGPEEGGEEASGRQEASGQPLCTHIVFTASGKGVSKAISCAEILKRRVGRLHQLTRLQFGSLEEVWEPLEPAAGLEPLTVSRKQPSLWILLSREPLDHSLPGYQAPGRYDALWAPEGQGGDGQKQGHKRKKGERGGERGGGVRGGGGGRGGGERGGGGRGRQTGRS